MSIMLQIQQQNFEWIRKKERTQIKQEEAK